MLRPGEQEVNGFDGHVPNHGVGVHAWRGNVVLLHVHVRGGGKSSSTVLQSMHNVMNVLLVRGVDARSS